MWTATCSNVPDVYSSFSLVDSVDESLFEDPPLSPSPPSLPEPSLPTLLDSLDVGEEETELSSAKLTSGLTLTAGLSAVAYV